MADVVTQDAVLVLATVDDLNAHFLAPVISKAATATRNRLTIVLFSHYFGDSNAVSHTLLWDDVQRLLTLVYVQATTAAQELDRVLMDVDVLLKGVDDIFQDELGTGVGICYRVEGDTLAVELPPSISSLPTVYLHAGERSSIFPDRSQSISQSSGSTPSVFPVVVLGGTFDHLHAGHKILLSMGAWITSQKLIIGVTDDALLVSKAFRETLEPLQLRMKRVRDFLTRFNPSLVYDIVPIVDVYGPTSWDANIQGLVVSRETLPGAASIASYRKSHSLPPLETFVIDVISSTSAKLDPDDVELMKKVKMSSTFIREWIVRNASG